MKTNLLPSMTLEEAMELQFKIVDSIGKEFSGSEFLNLSEVGLAGDNKKPTATTKAEKAFARIFGAQDAVLVRGAGTNAIASAISILCKDIRKIVIHNSPIYTTTRDTLIDRAIDTYVCDFHDLSTLEKAREFSDVLLVQHTRQKEDDHYDISKVISRARELNFRIICDDNYAVGKVKKIGVELGADVSCFSNFKLLGPEGIGCVVGKSDIIKAIKDKMYSGGMQVQGFEAIEALRGFVYVPVAHAVAFNELVKTSEIVKEELNEFIQDTQLVNAQSRVLIVRFKRPIAREVLKLAREYGVATYPVGAESKYEVLPMFYRLSGSFIKNNPELEDYAIRINPMRAGSGTIVSVLKEIMTRIENVSK